jgi:hypothetical protein
MLTRNVQYRLDWNKQSGGRSHKLSSVNLDANTFDNGGIYVIWCGGTSNAKAQVVYIGQADVFRNRLKAHREDPRIQKYAGRVLYVEWARVTKPNRDGIEAYLARRYSPLVGERHPDVTSIVVNSPWEK